MVWEKEEAGRVPAGMGRVLLVICLRCQPWRKGNKRRKGIMVWRLGAACECELRYEDPTETIYKILFLDTQLISQPISYRSPYSLPTPPLPLTGLVIT